MKKHTALFVSLLCLILISYLCLLGTGFFPAPSVFEVAGFCALLMLLSGSNLLFYGLLVPIVVLHAFYAPVGLSFGGPNYAYVASLFATDLSEGAEFFKQIPVKHYLLSAAIIILLILFAIITKSQRIQWHKQKTIIALGILCALLSTTPLKLFSEGYSSTMKVQAEMNKLKKLQKESQWGNSTLSHSQYDDYVLIIGESVRRDYMHAYGYPVENTPFMSKAKGTLVKGLTAGGTNTIASLRLMLTKPIAAKWEPNYEYTLVDLIKSAGLKTYWLSMQGQLGTFDTPISSIGAKADESLFLRAGDSFSKNVSDFNILPEFEKVIAQPSKQKRFIVLHLYGSHPYVCDRIEDYPLIFDENQVDEKYAYVNCYITSIKKTDEILQKVYKTLVQNQQKTHRTFSMLYFADHGLAHQEIDGKILINLTAVSKFHYDIPLFKISSDDTERKELESFKSALNFTDAIGNWVGISNPKLNPKADLFSGVKDFDDYGLVYKIQKIRYPEDPAIVIPLKKSQ